MRRLAGLLLTTAAVAAGCGGGEPGAPNPLLEAVPADAVMWAQADLDPGEDVDALIRRIAGRDGAVEEIISLLEGELRGTGAEIDFARDVEPWLGYDAGLFVSSFDGEPVGAVVATVDDEAAAREKLPDLLPGRRRSEGGIERVGDLSYAVQDGFAVVGHHVEVVRALEARGGDADSLDDSERYADAVDGLVEERIGELYLDVAPIFDALPPADQKDFEPYSDALRDAESAAFAVALTADEDSLAAELVLPEEFSRRYGVLSGPDSSHTPLLADLPSDAWLTFGIPNWGEYLRKGFEDPQVLGATAGQIERGLGMIERYTGIDLRDRITELVDDVALFVGGKGTLGARGGVVLQSDDPSALVGELRRAAESAGLDAGGFGDELVVTGLPVSVNVGVRDDRVGIAIGPGGVDGLLEPEETFGESARAERTADDLGDGMETSFTLDLGPVLEFARSAGAEDDPDAAAALPYLERLQDLSVGDRVEDGRHVIRLALGTK